MEQRIEIFEEKLTRLPSFQQQSSEIQKALLEKSTTNLSEKNDIYVSDVINGIYNGFISGWNNKPLNPWDMVQPCMMELQIHIKSGDNWIIDDEHGIIQASGYLQNIDPAMDEECRLFRNGEWRKV